MIYRKQSNSIAVFLQVESIRKRIRLESWEGIQPVDDLPGHGRGVKAVH